MLYNYLLSFFLTSLSFQTTFINAVSNSQVCVVGKIPFLELVLPVHHPEPISLVPIIRSPIKFHGNV